MTQGWKARAVSQFEKQLAQSAICRNDAKDRQRTISGHRARRASASAERTADNRSASAFRVDRDVKDVRRCEGDWRWAWSDERRLPKHINRSSSSSRCRRHRGSEPIQPGAAKIELVDTPSAVNIRTSLPGFTATPAKSLRSLLVPTGRRWLVQRFRRIPLPMPRRMAPLAPRRMGLLVPKRIDLPVPRRIALMHWNCCCYWCPGCQSYPRCHCRFRHRCRHRCRCRRRYRYRCRRRCRYRRRYHRRYRCRRRCRCHDRCLRLRSRRVRKRRRTTHLPCWRYQRQVASPLRSARYRWCEQSISPASSGPLF